MTIWKNFSTGQKDTKIAIENEGNQHLNNIYQKKGISTAHRIWLLFFEWLLGTN
jgi:hypothetical protein